MLARDGLHRRESLLNPFLTGWIGIEIGLVTFHRLDALTQRNQAFLDQLCHRRELWIELADMPRGGQRSRDHLFGAHIVGFTQQLDDFARARSESSAL